QDGAGNFCRILVGISPDEAQWASTAVVGEMNQRVHATGTNQGWNVVTGITSQFLDHGYCADDHYVVQVLESFANQNDQNGGFHPNGKGQAVYARALTDRIVDVLNLDVATPAPAWNGFALTAAQTITAANTTSLAAGDVNGDSLPDLVAGANGSPTRLFLNRGSSGGSWQGFDEAGATTIATAATRAVALADLTGDQKLDLIVGNNGANSIAYRNKGISSGTWQGFDLVATTVIGSGATTSLGVGDLDGDGRADVVLGNDGGDTTVHLNAGSTGTTWDGFETAATLASAAVKAVAVGDVNGDGIPDVILGVGGATSLLFVNRGRDAAGNWRDFKPGKAVGSGTPATTAVLLANIDTDRDVDLFLGNNGTGANLIRAGPVTVTRIAFNDVSVGGLSSGGDALSIDEGEGAFVLSDAGLAGTLSGKVSVGFGGASSGFSAGLSISVRINTTTSAVDETIELAGRRLEIRFSATEVATAGGPYIQFSGSGVIRIGDFVEIRGTITFTGDEASGTDLTVFLGQGPAFLADNTTINPNARGFYLTDGSFRLLRDGTGTIVALSASGDVSVTGIPSVVLSGTARVKYNATGAAQFSGDHALLATDTESFGGSLLLEVAGQQLSGQMTFAKSGADFTVTFTNVTINLGDGPPYAISATASGSLTVTPGGVYGEINGNASINVTGVSISSGVAIRVNTTSAPVDPPGPTPLLPANSFRVTALGLTLTIGGQSLSGDFAFEQILGDVSPQAPPGTAPPKIVRVAAVNVRLFVGNEDGDNVPSAGDAGVWFTGGSGFFVAAPGGIAGRLTGTVDFRIPGAPVTFTGTFSVAINNTLAAVAAQFQVGAETITLNLPGGPYVRVEGIDVVLALAGQRLRGDFVFERASTATGVVTRILARNVSAAFGTGTTDVVTLDDGFGFFLIGASGLAGEVSGNVSISIPGVSVSGRFSLAFNNGPQVDATIALGPQPDLTRAAVIGDVNGDARPDLIVGTDAGGNFLYLNDGDGDPYDSLPAIRIAAESDATRALALGDVDGDGDVDLVVAVDGTANPNRIYLNDGFGIFTLVSSPAAALGNGGSSIALGDVDGDGDLDAVIGVDGGTTRLYLNSGVDAGTGTWSAYAAAGAALFTAQTGTNTTSVALADLDKDGDLDLVVGNRGQRNAFYKNNGGASWTGFAAAADLGTQTDNTVALAIGDVDGDGYLDVVAANNGQQSVAYLNHTIAGTTPVLRFGPGRAFGTAVAAAVVALADVDTDGDLDVILGLDGAQTLIHANNGTTTRSGTNGTIAVGSAVFTSPTGAFVAGDVGSLLLVDGARYVVTTAPITPPATATANITVDRNFEAAKSNAAWTLRTWNGFAAATQLAGAAASTSALALGDLNNDGNVDLIVANKGLGQGNRFYASDSDAFVAPVRIGSVEVHLAGGQYLRVVGQNVVVSILGQTLTGGFAFEQRTQADGTRYVGVVVTNARLNLGDGLVELTLSGALVITSAGLAGELSLGASLNLGPVTLEGALKVAINTTTAPVLLPNGTRLDAGQFFRIEGVNILVRIGEAELRGNFLVQSATNTLGQRRLTIAASNVSIKLSSSGPALLTGGEGVLLVLPGGLAGQLGGSIDLGTLIPGVTLLGTFGVAINRTNQAINETVTVGGQSIVVNLPAGPFLRFSGNGVTLSILGQTLSGNFAVEQTRDLGPNGVDDGGAGDDSTVLVIAATNVSLRLGAGGTDFVTLSGGEGLFVKTAAGLAGTLSATVALNIPGVSIAGALRLELNTTSTAIVNKKVLVGGVVKTINVDAGPFLRVGGTNVTLDVLGQKLGGDFFFEQTATAGPNGTLGDADDLRTVRLATRNVKILLGDDNGTPANLADDIGLRLTQKVGQEARFVVTNAGLAGELAATVELVGLNSDAFSIGPIDFLLQINNTNRAINETFFAGATPSTLVLPVGPYLRAQIGTVATPVSITVFGQQLSGVFSFERITNAGADGVLGTSDDRRIVRIAASNVELFLGDNGGTPADQSDDVGVRVTNGSAKFLLTADGFAGEISAGASIRLSPSISASVAEARIQINQMARLVDGRRVPIAVNETFLVGGRTETLALPIGPFFRVDLNGLELTVFGQRLSGNFSVQQTTNVGNDGALGGSGPAADTTTTRITASNVGLRIGSDTRDFVVVSNGAGDFTIVGKTGATPGGVYGSLSANVAVDIPGVSLSGMFAVQLNTTTTTQGTISPGIKVTGTGVVLEVLGQRLSGNFTFEKNTLTNVVSITVDATLALGNGSTTFLTLDLDGAITLTNAGMAASLTAAITSAPSFGSDFALLGTPTITLQINTAPTTLMGIAPGLRVQVGAPGNPVGVRIFGQELRAVLVFEQTRTAAGASVIRVGFTEASLFVGDPGAGTSNDGDETGLRITNGSGSILITPLGFAGKITASVAIVGSLPIGLTVSEVTVEINRLATAIDETITFNGPSGAVTQRLNLPAGPFIRVAAYGVTVSIGGTAGFSGDFLFEQATAVVTTGGSPVPVTKIGVANLQFNAAGGFIQGAQGALVILPNGIAGVVSGRAAGTAGGFALGATLGLEINTTPGPVNTSVTVNGVVIPVRIDSTGFTFVVQDLDFDFGFLEVRGNFRVGSGTFVGSGLEVFIGKGPEGEGERALRSDGTVHPDAIGLLLRNASLSFQRIGSGPGAAYALYAAGTLALIGLDGLQVEGTLILKVNTATGTTPTVLADPDTTDADAGPFSIAPGTFSLTGANIHFRVGQLLDIHGTVGVTRQPNGTLDVAFQNAGVTITIDGTEVFSISGNAAFQIHPVTGFRLQSFKVNDFSIFGVGGGASGGSTP
ncbi:MAG TPA: VCBS repeat-containing protein, partial [Actinomycetota bacterium]